MKSLSEFKDFLTNKKVYEANVKYWNDLLLFFCKEKSKNIIIPYYKDSFSNNVLFYDGNPITSAYILSLNKSIRVIQHTIDGHYSPYLYGWVTEQKDLQNKFIQELVLEVEPTKESEYLAKYLIQKWIGLDCSVKEIKEDLDKINSLFIEEGMTNKEWLKSLQNNFEIYFIFLEVFAQPKTKMRTFKKMFYDKKKEIGQANILESEVEVNQGYSRLLAVLNVTEDNFETCYNSINSNFFFALLTDKTKDICTNKSKLTQELEKLLIGKKEDKLLVFNDIKNYLKEGSVLVTIKSDNDCDEVVVIHFPNVNFTQ